MQIVIIGAGKVGTKIAKRMSNMNNDVTIIESNKEVAKKVNSNLDCKVINGLEFDKSILESANVRQANCIIVTTESDNTNIMVGKVLKEIFNVKDIIISLSNPSLAKIYEKSEFKIICPTNIIADAITNIIG